jgi:Xaa-Pro aminopeptidase
VRDLAGAAAERELDVLLVSDMADVRWLTGFTGSSALAALSVAGPGAGALLTDFRYLEQVAEQVDPSWHVAQVTRDLLGPGVGEQLDAIWPHERPARIGFDDRSVTVHAHERLREAIGERAELVAAGGLVAPLREIKDSGEASRVREAARLADRALLDVLERGLAGRTEAAVALDLEVAIRGLGAEALSFEPIVAAGAHGALPHAQPRDVEIERGQLVTIDWGCRLDGYCSDCTRTFAAGGGVEDDALAVYELVLRAQLESLAAVAPGAEGRAVDAVARAIIEQAGHGEHFGHGLGHGVGLEVHEGPRLSKLSESTLAAGMVVTVEPGVYLPGRFGVRIEDLVLVTPDGHEVLNGLPKELQEIG